MASNSKRIFYLGNRYLVPFLAFLSAFGPLSTDMYLPSMPLIAETLRTSNEMVSYSISSFMLIFACSMLFWGPLSDKYGRRPVLISGSLLYIVSSAGIALSESIWPLLIWRGLQAIGSGACASMSLAIVKDVMRGEMMEKLVSIMQACMIISPLTAPVIGGGILLFVSWQGIFWVLAICGALSLLGTLLLKETASIPSAASIFATFARIRIVLANRRFRHSLLIFSAMSMPFMSYLGVSAFIYQDTFGLSPQIYSLFFAFNACFSLLGPISHLYFLRHIEREKVLGLELAAMCLGGILIIAAGSRGAWLFALLFAPVTFCGSAMRAPSTLLMMEAIEGDNGIVASLIHCCALIFGSLSMFIASQQFWPGPVLAVGAIATCVSGACIILWIRFLREHVDKKTD